MKYLIACLVCLIASTAVAGRVPLPQDANKLTVTVFARTAADAKAFVASHPQIAAYKAGSHYNVYTAQSPFTKSRFGNVKMPSAYVQRADGSVVAQVVPAGCPLLKRWRGECNPQKQQESNVDEADVEDEDEPGPVSSDEPNPLLLLLVGVAALAAGAGSKFYEELKTK